MFNWGRIGMVGMKAAAVGCILAYVRDSAATFVIFKGGSMLPTIQEHDIGLCEKITGYKQIRRGDVVVAVSPTRPGTQICKRVIALEGDELNFDLSDDETQDEIIKFKNSHFIPRGHIWLEGDNGSSSHDSRHFGPVPLGLVKSRVIGKIYPFRSATLFAREPPNEKWVDE